MLMWISLLIFKAEYLKKKSKSVKTLDLIPFYNFF